MVRYYRLAFIKDSGSPYECKNFSADMKLTCFLVSDNAFIGGNDSDSQSAKYSRQLVLASVNTKARFRDSLKTCDDLVILGLAVFQSDMDVFHCSILYQIIFCDISLVYQDICDSDRSEEHTSEL